ncbi:MULTISPECIES: hypothetical protein [unclassified Streptomyces]|uniref:hypothetical protein n=1 Tax=unclassified Streptomyces TaxID=2593676 RepID=UPI00224EDB36|nr:MULTISPECIES: hypothetical protein [unclassified Streptomyces]MCX4527339.1 hypothetical protein [Streptomyces sp. NBC_01551]MCX4542081.1 hypothetical protein [Streptomyces sp. NBC_01565]
MDMNDEGAPLDPRWSEAEISVCGQVMGLRSAAAVAGLFVRAGWSSRSSSREGYEVETAWASFEIDPIETGVLLNGVADPQRLDVVAGLLRLLGRPFGLEHYDEEGVLVREIKE